MGKISTGMMGFALILFLLPWISLSCGGQKVFTFSGTDMAIGKTLETPQAFGKQVKQTTREWKATLALIAGIIGTIAGFAAKEARVQQIVLTACSGIGGISLFLLRNKLNTDIFKEAGGMVTIDYHFGFWAAMLLFFSVSILNVLSLKGVLDKDIGSVEKAISLNLKSPPQASFCGQCGAKVLQDDTFCSECGRALK
jgi:hypothetical protein